MKETKYNIENTSNREVVLSIYSKEDGVVIKLFHDNELRTDIINKGINTWKIRSNEQVDFIMDTTKSWVVTPNNKFLKAVDGPIQYIEGNDLHSVFKGCYSLVSVSEDLFARNSDKRFMTSTFKDCVEFALTEENRKMFKYLTKVSSMIETFANNNNRVIPASVFINDYALIELRRTFKDNVYLESISNKPFENIFCVELVRTFENCTSLKTVHSEFFKAIRVSSVLNRTFKGAGITKIDPNILTHIASGVIYDEIFLDCKCEINKEFK